MVRILLAVAYSWPLFLIFLHVYLRYQTDLFQSNIPIFFFFFLACPTAKHLSYQMWNFESKKFFVLLRILKYPHTPSTEPLHWPPSTDPPFTDWNSRFSFTQLAIVGHVFLCSAHSPAPCSTCCAHSFILVLGSFDIVHHFFNMYCIYSCTSRIFWTWKWAQKIDLDLYSGEHETYLRNHKKMPKFTATSQVTELSK